MPATTDVNPYQRLLYRHLADHGVDLVREGELAPEWLAAHRDDVDVIHVHWRLDRLVDRAGATPRTATARTAAQARADTARLRVHLAHARDLGYRIAWTVHEIGLLEPDGPTIEHLAAVEIGRAADVVMAHNHVSATQVVDRGLAPAERVRVVPLGHYGDAHPDGPSPTRADLGIPDDAVVFLAFGNQRADKALDLLFDAFDTAATRRSVLVVAGFHDDVAERARLGERIGDDPRVRLLDTVPDEQVTPLHRLADATVLARSHEWTPSSLVLSLSLGVPAVAADLASVAEHGGPGVFPFHPGDSADLARVLARVAADPAARRARGRAGRSFVRSVTWDDTARATAAAFRAAVHDARGGDDVPSA